MAIWDALITEEDREAYGHFRGRQSIGVGERPAILVVDMTYAFVDSMFSSGFSKTGWPCVRAIKDLLDVARPKHIPVAFTGGNHWKTPAEYGRWKSAGYRPRTPEAKTTDPHQIVAELQPLDDEPVVRKSKPSAFFGTHLSSILTYHGVDTVIVTGMVTSGCVRATVVDAFSLNYRVMVPQECVADRGQVTHKINLFDMHMKYADVVPLAEAKEYLIRVKPWVA